MAADLLHAHTLQQYASLAQHHAATATSAPAPTPSPTTQRPHSVNAQLCALDTLLQGSWREAARGVAAAATLMTSSPLDSQTINGTEGSGEAVSAHIAPWSSGLLSQPAVFPALQRALLLLWAVPLPSSQLLQLLQENAAQQETGIPAGTSKEQACCVKSVHACAVGAIQKLLALVPVHHLLHDTLMEVGRGWGVAAEITACGQGESPTASLTPSRGGSVDRDGVQSMLYLTF